MGPFSLFCCQRESLIARSSGCWTQKMSSTPFEHRLMGLFWRTYLVLLRVLSFGALNAWVFGMLGTPHHFLMAHLANSVWARFAIPLALVRQIFWRHVTPTTSAWKSSQTRETSQADPFK